MKIMKNVKRKLDVRSYRKEVACNNDIIMKSSVYIYITIGDIISIMIIFIIVYIAFIISSRYIIII